MRYYKQIENGYIMAIGTGGGETEITSAEYDEIMAAIQNKPPTTETIDYRLKEDLTWEQYQVEPPVPDYNPPEGLQESAEYMFGNNIAKLTNSDMDPDYMNEHEKTSDYFNQKE